MKEDRACFGIGLQFGKGPVIQDEIGLARADITLTMAARHALAIRNMAFRHLTVGIGPTRLEGAGFVCGHRDKRNGGH